MVETAWGMSLSSVCWARWFSVAQAFRFQFNPLTIVHLLLLAATGVLLFHARYRMRVSGLARTYQLGCAAAILWALFEVFELLCTDPSGRMFWVQMQAFGFGAAGPAWLFFMLHLVRHPHRNRLSLKGVLWGIYLVCLVVVWSNPLHNQFFIVDPSATWTFRPGLLFWVVVGLQYLLMFVGMAVALAFSLRSESLRRSAEPLVLAGGALVPAAVVLVRQLGVMTAQLDGPAILVYAVVGFVVLRNHLPTLRTPLSLPMIMESVDAALAGLTPEGFVAETNQRFRNIFGGRLKAAGTLAVKTAGDILAAMEPINGPPELERLATLGDKPVMNPMRVTFRVKSDERVWCSLHFQPIKVGRTVMGYLLQLRDVSDIARLTSSLQDREMQLEQAHSELALTHAHLEAAHEELAQHARNLEMMVEAKAVKLEEKQQQLLHAQKMESLGTLASGIAHDFNNILFSLIGYADLIVDSSSDADEVTHCARKIKDGAQRASELTAKLLGFGRRSKPVMEPVHPAEIAADVAELLRRTVEARISFGLDIADPAVQVQADAAQLHQVLMNICLNAAESISGVGEVNLILSGSLLGADVQHRYPGVDANGDYVELVVSDTGCGMSDEVKNRMFEPFFTTKTRGKGTGLGLSLVYGIVQDHGGLVDVTSTPGAGTVFRILVPERAADEPEKAAAGTQAAAGTRQDRAPSATQYSLPGRTGPRPSTFDGLQISGATLGILVIDDNEEVLSLCRRYFAEPLFHVWTAGTATDGLSVLRDNPAAVDVVLLDLIVPDASPEDAFGQCMAVNPNVAVVVMSGYHADPRINALLRAGAKGFLRKPFSRKEVRAAVRRILEE